MPVYLRETRLHLALRWKQSRSWKLNSVWRDREGRATDRPVTERDRTTTCTRTTFCPLSTVGPRWMNRTNTRSNLQPCLLENSCRAARLHPRPSACDATRRDAARRRAAEQMFRVIYTRLLKNSISSATFVMSSMKISSAFVYFN